MSHRKVVGPEAFRLLNTAYRNDAVTAVYHPDRTAALIGDQLNISESSVVLFCEPGVHPSDITGLVLNIRNNRGVPIHLMNKLYPCHVHLGKGRTSPLSCLQYYCPDRQPLHPCFLKGCKGFSLRLVELKGDDLLCVLILHLGADNRPELKIVLESDLCKIFDEL